MKNLLSIFLITTVFISCSKDDVATLDKGNFLVFGHFYGQCFGEGCVETFKLTSNKLYEDTIDDYSGSEFNFIELDNDAFEQVKDLTDYFPNRLLDANESVFGCPDCADGGGLFIQYSNNGQIKSWRIDQLKSNVPTYLHNFINKVNEKISLIDN